MPEKIYIFEFLKPVSPALLLIIIMFAKDDMSEQFKLFEVTDRKSIESFLELPVNLYHDDKNWIRPLDQDIEKIFDPRLNKKLNNGDAIRWILKDSNQKTVGRIAAFCEHSKAKKNEPKAGGCGFFECINNQEAANILFDAAQNWLKQHEMEAMDGPVNFGSREMFWGCLADGFYEPNYNMPYNQPYYNNLFTAYGFKNYFNQYTYHMPLDPSIMDPSIKENADRCNEDPKFKFININKNQLDKFTNDFTVIFNEAWANFPGVKPMHLKQTKKMFKAMKQVIDTRALIFGYYDDRPVGFFMMIPDLYQSYKKFNGKFGPINKLRLMYDLKISKQYTKLLGLIFGVVPEFQKRGVAGGMIMHFAKQVNKPGFHYTDLEMNWIGDFNPGMIKLVEQLGATVKKTHITYRYLFDRKLEFKRALKVN